MGSQIGVAIAAIVMIGGTEIMRELDFLKLIFGPTFDPTQYRMLLFGFAMVLIMIWRPRGLISTREPSVFLKERKIIAADLSRKDTADGDLAADILLRVEHLTMRFGGLVAVDDLSFSARARRHHRADRAERRRQDHRIQLHHRFLQAERRPARSPSRRSRCWDWLEALTGSGETQHQARREWTRICSSGCPTTWSPSTRASPARFRISACFPA